MAGEGGRVDAQERGKGRRGNELQKFAANFGGLLLQKVEGYDGDLREPIKTDRRQLYGREIAGDIDNDSTTQFITGLRLLVLLFIENDV